MEFLRKMTILGLLLILLANEVIIVRSRKTSILNKVFNAVDKVSDIVDKGTELSDQVSETVGISNEKSSTVLDVGLQVAEVVSSFAPSPVGPLLSLGLGLFNSAYRKTEKSDEVKAIEAESKESERRDLETQAMISERVKQLYEMENGSKARDEQTQGMITNQMMMLENMDETSRERDLKTHEMIENQMIMLTEMNMDFERRHHETLELLKMKSDKLGSLVEEISIKIPIKIAHEVEKKKAKKDFDEHIRALESHYNNSMACIYGECSDKLKEDYMKHAYETSSKFRMILDLFIENHIEKETAEIYSPSQSMTYYKIFLDDDKSKILEYEDCESQSSQTRVLKTYVRIIKTLTDSWSLVGIALAFEFQSRIKANKKVYSVENSFKVTTDQFLEQLRTLMSETKSMLSSVSGEIRKCGPTIPSEEYESLEFLKTGLFAYGNSFLLRRDQANIYSPLMWEYLKSKGPNIPLNYIHYSKFNCQNTNWKTIEYYFDPDEPIPGYHHIEDGSETYGKIDDKTDLARYDITGDIKQCYIYNTTKKVGFSTQTVDAQPGHVITGIRWRITDNIVYIDIKEAKFIDGLRVDISTEEWYETPESDELVQPFTQNLRGILLADVKLNTGFYVTGVKMISIDGKLTLSVRGSGTNDQGTKLFGQQSYVQPKKMKRSEWKINEADDPDFGEAKNVSKKVQRDQTKYYVNLQPTDFKKDLGRKTIPYFDIQEIITYPPAPIGGLGIYYKVFEGYGGFVALKMFSPDYRIMIDERKLEMYKQSFKLNSSKIGQLNSTKTGPLNGKKTG